MTFPGSIHPDSPDMNAWRRKAVAFVTRCHQHLFGKNNEDPLVYLFANGLKNDLAKDLLVGWNKFSQERPPENWGFGPGPEKLLLPKGLVIPYIVDKTLLSIFIHAYDGPGEGKTRLIPGSLSSSLILGNQTGRVAVLQHLMDGLFLFQETKGQVCVIIQPDPEARPDPKAISVMEKALQKRLFFSNPGEKEIYLKFLPPAFKDFLFPYTSGQDLISAVSLFSCSQS